MKKAIALVMVCGFALAFVSCGGGGAKTDESAGQDTTAMAPQDTTAQDTTKTDTTQMN